MKNIFWALLLAAGKGSRFNSSDNDLPKQFIPFHNQPLYWHSARKMAASGFLSGILFVFPEHNFTQYKEKLVQLCGNNILGIPWDCTTGGDTRKESVYRGLLKLPSTTTHVIIHDAARPFFNSRIMADIYRKLLEGATAVVPGIPVIDTIKILQDDDLDVVYKTLPRKKLVSVQTPQGYLLNPLMTCHLKHNLNNEITDDAMLLESAGHKVHIIPGNVENIKITLPGDQILLQEKRSSFIPVSGLGYDVHRFGQGHPLKLGGISIPYSRQIVSHSDGDILFHALIDGILGCAGLGDIGEHFPDSDIKYKDISSSLLLQHTLNIVQNKIQIYHLDVTIITQQPRISVFKNKIRDNIAALLKISEAEINIKATTEEGLGFTGALEGIKVYVLVNAWQKS